MPRLDDSIGTPWVGKYLCDCCKDEVFMVVEEPRKETFFSFHGCSTCAPYIKEVLGAESERRPED